MYSTKTPNNSQPGQVKSEIKQCKEFMMWTDITMDKPSMSKGKVGNNYTTQTNY